MCHGLHKDVPAAVSPRHVRPRPGQPGDLDSTIKMLLRSEAGAYLHIQSYRSSLFCFFFWTQQVHSGFAACMARRLWFGFDICGAAPGYTVSTWISAAAVGNVAGLARCALWLKISMRDRLKRHRRNQHDLRLFIDLRKTSEHLYQKLFKHRPRAYASTQPARLICSQMGATLSVDELRWLRLCLFADIFR